MDEVNITVETCENTKNSKTSVTTNNGEKNSPGTAFVPTISQIPPSKYSFIHKVIDGITIVVNTVYVKFLSLAFIASVQVKVLGTCI